MNNGPFREVSVPKPDTKAFNASVTNCDDEPIRIPGSIQSHGLLLVVDPTGQRVIAASENAPEFLGVPLVVTLGMRLDTILEPSLLAAVRDLDDAEELSGQITYLGTFPLRSKLFSVVTHLVASQRVLEFEEVEGPASAELMNVILTNFVGKLSTLKTEAQLYQALTKQVAELTGFDRVLLYSFDESGHGTVLAEENNGALPSYLDLRFPASDIPQQARELYLLSTVRIIPDATYRPSPLSGVDTPSMRSFDLSLSVLRSVSPIHLEYMQNMGTLASMSISLIRDGALWGLISCHNAQPRRVAFLVRSACDLLAKMVSTQTLAFQSAARLNEAIDFHAVQRGITAHLAAEYDFVSAIRSQLTELIQITNAEGVVLLVDGTFESHGSTPPYSAVQRIARWLNSQADLKLFTSTRLQNELSWAHEIEDVASGIVAIRISDVRQNYLMWFRPQLISLVKWAGEPVKRRDPDGGLHPRNSFKLWQQTVHGRSAPWTAMEIESAQNFRTSVMAVNLKRAEEALQLREEFLSHVSHELRSPLTSIYSFSSIIADNLAGETTLEQQEYLGIVLKNVVQLESMVEDLLTVTQSKEDKPVLDLGSVSIADAIADVVDMVQAAARGKKIELTSYASNELPPAWADPTRLRQLLIILLDNAIKYTPAEGTISIQASRFHPGLLLIQVIDTGYGIPQEKLTLIFDKLYQIRGPHSIQADQAGRSGLGLGLYIAKRLVTQHGGSIWATSVPGQGSTFNFTLPVSSEKSSALLEQAADGTPEGLGG